MNDTIFSKEQEVDHEFCSQQCGKNVSEACMDLVLLFTAFYSFQYLSFQFIELLHFHYNYPFSGLNSVIFIDHIHADKN